MNSIVPDLDSKIPLVDVLVTPGAIPTPINNIIIPIASFFLFMFFIPQD